MARLFAPKFEIKKYHKNMGHEGEGFNVELWVDGVLTAYVIDEGCGGCPLYQWVDFDKMKVVQESIAAHPPKVYPKYGSDEEFSVKYDQDTFINDLVDEFLVARTFKRKCKKKTCYKLKSQKAGSYYEMAAVFNAEVARKLREKWGDDLEVIYNEKFAEVK